MKNKILTSIILIISLSISLYGQNNDSGTIFLKDGSIIKGKILSETNSYMKLKLSNGKIKK